MPWCHETARFVSSTAFTPWGKLGSSWLKTVSGACFASWTNTGSTNKQVGQSRFTKATRPSGRGGRDVTHRF